MTQIWLNQRFSELTSKDFEEGVHFLSLANINPPADIPDMWTIYQKGQEAAALVPVLKDKKAIFIWGSPTDQQQILSLREFVQSVDAHGADAPPMIWVPHTVTPEVRPHTAVVDPTPRDGQSVVSGLLEIGLDGVVHGEPQGFMLAATLNNWVHKVAIQAGTIQRGLLERRRQANNLECFKDRADSLLWDFLRTRLSPAIPPCDRNLPTGEPDRLDGFSFGSCRRTPAGLVYRLNRKPTDGGLATMSGGNSSASSTGGKEVAKLVDKQTIRDIFGMMSLKRMVDVLWIASTEKWQHPNVQRLFKVYHSPTHIIFRMEYGGAGSLYDRLERRQRPGKARPLSFNKTSQIINQVVRAVSHLHQGPKVCHRDIKTENFDLHETPDSATVKLCNFELAVVQEDPLMYCQQVCGSIPFVAPEVFQSHGYLAMAADIWSVAILLFEILCGSGTFEEALKLLPEDQKAQSKVYRRPDANYAKKVTEGFQRPHAAGRLLQTHCYRDLEPLCPVLRPMLEGMLCLDPKERWTSADLLSSIENLPKGPPTRPLPLQQTGKKPEGEDPETPNSMMTPASAFAGGSDGDMTKNTTGDVVDLVENSPEMRPQNSPEMT